MLWFVVDVILDKDASGKPGSGVAGGNLVWLGSYSLCQNMSEAHYCLAPKITLELKGFVSILHFTNKWNKDYFSQWRLPMLDTHASPLAMD